MNVNPEANAAFMTDLKRLDSKRHVSLIHNMEKDVFGAVRKKTAGKTCRHCGLLLPSDIRRDAAYCDSACKKAAQRAKAAPKAA